MEWGVYPEGLEYDAGGATTTGWGEQVIDPVMVARDAQRAAHYKRNMEQRGSNNAYLYETEPRRLRYAYGVGCMNPNCQSHNCHGDQFCAPASGVVGQFGWKQLFMLILAALIATFIYRRFVRR